MHTSIPATTFSFHTVCCRQQKAKQLIDLQSELQLLDSDIMQVAARQVEPSTAGHPDQSQPHLPARQRSTHLLQERLQEAMTTVADAANQPTARSKTADAQGQSMPGAAAQTAPAMHVRPSAMLASVSASLAQAQASASPQQPTSAVLASPVTSPLAAAAIQQTSEQAGTPFAQPGGSQLPSLASSSQQHELSNHQTAAAAAIDAARSLQPRLSRASNGYLMIDHPYAPTIAPPPHPSVAASPSAAPGTSTSVVITAPLVSAPVVGSAVPPVPLPTQMDRQQSMHIHPRHLAFQHFHQQQAALQQRQQPAGHGSGGVGGGAAASNGGMPVEDPSSQAATQEAAVRYDQS